MTGKPRRAPARLSPFSGIHPAARPQLPTASAKALAEACAAADAEIPGHLNAQLGATETAPVPAHAANPAEPAPASEAEVQDKPAPAAKAAAATKDA